MNTRKAVVGVHQSASKGEEFRDARNASHDRPAGWLVSYAMLGISDRTRTLQVTNYDTVTHNIIHRPDQRENGITARAGPSAPLARNKSQDEVMIRREMQYHSWSKVHRRRRQSTSDHGADGTFEIRNVPRGDT